MKLKQGLAGLVLAASVAAGVSGCKEPERITICLPADWPVVKTEITKIIEGIEVKYRVRESPVSSTKYTDLLLFVNEVDNPLVLYLGSKNGVFNESELYFNDNNPFENTLSDKYDNDPILENLPKLYDTLVKYFEGSQKELNLENGFKYNGQPYNPTHREKVTLPSKVKQILQALE